MKQLKLQKKETKPKKEKKEERNWKFSCARHSKHPKPKSFTNFGCYHGMNNAGVTAWWTQDSPQLPLCRTNSLFQCSSCSCCSYCFCSWFCFFAGDSLACISKRCEWSRAPCNVIARGRKSLRCCVDSGEFFCRDSL
jgi:hypothetical protein